MYKVDSPIIFKQHVFQCSSVFIPNIYTYNCRLGKTLPTHTMSNYCSKLEIQDDDDDDDDRYEDIIQEYDDCSYSPELSQSYIAESKARTAMKENQEEEQGSCFDSSENILKDRDGTKKEYATDRKNLVDKESSLSRESKSANKTNLNQRAKPFYVNDQELKADDTSNPLYVNQNQPETKPALPPRKPLNKK